MWTGFQKAVILNLSAKDELEQFAIGRCHFINIGIVLCFTCSGSSKLLSLVPEKPITSPEGLSVKLKALATGGWGTALFHAEAHSY